MAQAPMSMPPGAAAAGGMMGGDPADAGADAGGDVVVTICRNGDGSYTVYPGDEPDSGGDSADMSEDDVDAMGPAGAAPAGGGGGAPSSQGQSADSIGAALKVALDIMNADKSSEGAPGNADDQLAAGFSASKSPTPASMGQKY